MGSQGEKEHLTMTKADRRQTDRKRRYFPTRFWLLRLCACHWRITTLEISGSGSRIQALSGTESFEMCIIII